MIGAYKLAKNNQLLIKIDNVNASMYLFVAMRYMLQEKWGKARKYFTLASKCWTYDADGHRARSVTMENAATCLLMLNKHDEALEAYKAVMEHNEKHGLESNPSLKINMAKVE